MSFLGLAKSRSALGAALLVTGCCIGAGMVGLPVVSALAGFMPSVLATLFSYLFTTATGLLLLEATLWFDNRVNLMSIAEFTLGKVGKISAMLLFLFLFYCLFVAYLDAGGQLFAEMLSAIFQIPISKKIGILTCLVMASGFTYAGTKIVDSFNRGLLIGLFLSYLALVAIGIPRISTSNLTHINWGATFATVPILLICFGYQNLVPSLTYYLKKNVNALRFAIIIGNFIPFFIYSLWNMVILGMVDTSHVQGIDAADMVTQLLQENSHPFLVIFLIKSFSLFAILTSFLPNAISFIDFLKDGIKVSVESIKSDLFYLGLVFIPPTLCSLFYPNLFLEALGFAGGFIDVLLFGVLPATIVLIGRKKKGIKEIYQVAGGNWTPVCIIILSLVILVIKVS